jgi:hypothetical protein
MRGLLNSTSYFALRTPDGVGGGDNAGGATAGGQSGSPHSDAAAPASQGAGDAAAGAKADGGTAAAQAGGNDAAAGEAASATGDAAVGDAKATAVPAKDAAPASESHAPSLIEAAKGKEAAADGAAKPAEGEKPTPETPAKAETESKPAEPGKEAAKEPSAQTGAGEAKAADAAPEVKPPEPVKYDAFKVPETVKLEESRLKAFTDIVGPAQVKQDTAQALMDLHVGEITNAFKLAEQSQRDYWAKQIDTWKTQTRNDTEIGGNRLETSLSIAKAVVEEYGGSKEQQAELWQHISETRGNGMGNYVGFIRLMHNIGVALNVFEDSIVPAASAPAKRSNEPGQRGWYGGERRASAG